MFTWFIIWGCIFSTRYFREKIANQNLAYDTLGQIRAAVHWINHGRLEALRWSWELYPALRNMLSGSTYRKGEFKSSSGERRGWTVRPRQEGIEVVKSAGFHG